MLAFALGAFIGCKKGGENNTEIQYKIVVDGEDTQIDIGETYQMVSAYVTDLEGNPVDRAITYQVRNPNDTLILTSFGSFRCTSEGDYTVTYLCEGAESVVLTVTVKDMSPPEVTMGILPQLFADTDIRMPDIDFSDASDIDYAQTTIKMYKVNADGTETEYGYDEMKNEFHPDTAGYYTLRVHAVDTAGNAKDYAWTLNVVDPNWKPTSPLDEGVLADFATEDYRNTILNGTTRSWQSYNTLTWMNGYEGAEGVYKVDLQYNSYAYGYASFNYKFATPVKRSDVDAIAVRMYVENANCSMFMLFSYMYVTDPDTQVPVARFTDSLQEGQWFNIVLEGSVLDELANSEGYIEGFQLGGEHSQEDADPNLVIYLDEIFMAEKLSAPSGFSYTATEISWDAVADATGYVVEINGQEYPVTDTKMTLPTQESCIVNIKSVGNGRDFLDSDFGMFIVNREQLPEGYLSSFATDFYEQLVWTNTYGGGYWGPGSFAADYITAAEGTSDGALQLSLTFNSNSRGGFFLRFADAKAVADIDGNLLIRYKFDGDAQFVLAIGQTEINTVESVEDSDGWYLFRIPKSALANFADAADGVTVFIISNEGAGSSATLLLDYVRVEETVETPVIEWDGSKVTWEAAEHATSYIVEVNGEEFTVSATEYTFAEPGVYGVRIKGISDGYVDSEWSNMLFVSTAVLDDGYLSQFDEEGYEYSVASNTYGGGGYRPASFTAEYVASAEGTSDGALKISLTFNGTGRGAFYLYFADQLAVKDIAGNLLIRYKFTGTNSILPAIGQKELSDFEIIPADETGWGYIRILNSELANFTGNADGITIFLTQVESAAGASAEFWLDYVRVEETVETPVIEWDGSKITWEAAEHATGYIVEVNGEEFTVSDTEYTFAEPGVYGVRIKGIGEGYIDSGWSNTLFVSTAVLQEGYLSEFDEEGYEYSVTTDTYGGGYWGPGSFAADYITETDGTSDGALQLSFTFNGTGRGAFFLRFVDAKAVADIDGNLLIRYKFDGDAQFILAIGQTEINTVESVEDSDGWYLFRIPKSALANYADAADGITVFIVSNEGAGSSATLLLDYVRVEETAATPENIKVSGGKLVWDEAEGAVGYLVEINGGEPVEVTANEYALESGKVYSVRVMTKGEAGYADSAWSAETVVSTKEIDDAYLSDFSENGYIYTVASGTYGGSYWLPASFKPEYAASVEGTADGALKVTMLSNNNGAKLSSMRIRFVNPVLVADADGNLVIRMKFEQGTIAQIGVSGTNYFEPFSQSEPDEYGWITVTISNSQLSKFGDSISYLDILIQGGSTETPYAVWLDAAYIQTVLAVPANIAMNEGTITWDSVAGAQGYIVEVNGEEFEVQEAEYTPEVAADGIYIVRVKAVGGTAAADSAWSESVTFTAKTLAEGVYSDFSDKSYEGEFSWSVQGGWNAPSASTAYVPDVAGAADGAVVATITATSAGNAALRITLRKPIVVSELTNGLYIRFKLEGTGDGAGIYGLYTTGNKNQFYHAEGIANVRRYIKADAGGWQILQIPAGANFSGTVSSIDILIAAVTPSATFTFSFDYIADHVIGNVPPEGTFADFSDASYVYDISDIGRPNDWDAVSRSVTYAETAEGTSDGALHLELGTRTTFNTLASFKVTLRQPIEAGSSIVIRMKTDNIGFLYGIFFDGGSVDDGNNTKFTVAEDTDGWSLVTIDGSRVTASGSVIFMFANKEMGATLSLDLDYIMLSQS